MKALMRLIPLLLIMLNTFASGTTVKNGQNTEQVIATLGKPIGTIELREKTLLLYPQGEVTLEEGKVTEVDLMSQEQFDSDQERLRIEREEWLADQERRRIAHKQEGEALRATKMQSGAFASLPAKDKVDYWRSFQIRYPEVDVSAQIAGALESYSSELEELRTQQRIAELEARVAQAEQEAATARLETARLREETERSRRDQNFGLRDYSYTTPGNSRFYYRPPTITIYTNSHGDNTALHRKNKIDRRGEIDLQKESVAERATRILNQANQVNTAATN